MLNVTGIVFHLKLVDERDSPAAHRLTGAIVQYSLLTPVQIKLTLNQIQLRNFLD